MSNLVALVMGFMALAIIEGHTGLDLRQHLDTWFVIFMVILSTFHDTIRYVRRT